MSHRPKAKKSKEELEHLEKRLQELYEETKDKPVFTKEMLKFNAEQVAKLTSENTIISLMGRDGKVHEGFDLKEWMAHTKEDRSDFKYFTYLDIASDLKEWMFRGDYGNEDCSHWKHLMRLMEDKVPIYLMRFERCAHKPALESDLKRAEEIWTKENSDRKLIMGRLQSIKQTDETVEVKKIICFGLGPLWIVNFEDADKPGNWEPGWNLDHHLTAFDIAEVLKTAKCNKNKPVKPVPIIFQDPIYQKKDHEYLERLAKKRGLFISFVDNPQALLEVDAHTLVLAHGYPALPIRQLIADLTRPFNGPAGFFCRIIPPIPDLTKEIEEATDFAMNPPNRHVASMVADYGLMEVCVVEKWYSTFYLKRK